MREMTGTGCEFPGDRDETLIAYLYNDIEPAVRAAFDAHLPRCARCRDELSALGSVKAHLARWSPPEPSFVSRRPLASSPQPLASKWWQQVPVWAQVAAALVFLGVGAGLANLDVHYDRAGLRVRTGWSKPTASGVVQDFSPANNPANPAPWRAEMTALEQQLRTELHATAASSANAVNATNVGNPVNPGSAVNSEVLRRLKLIVDESEKRQQRELALRIAELMRDVNTQRQADLVKIDRSLGVLQSNTGVEVMRNRQMLNYLVTASQQRPQ